MNDAYDVVIAGGGPAGLAVAEPLAAGGYSVLVCERNAQIGVPVRTSGGSWTADVRALGLPDHLWHPIAKLSFRSRGSYALVDWGGPVGCSLDITATWCYLAERARAAGADVVTGALAHWTQPGALTVRRDAESTRVRCRLAIDATGTPSALSRRAGVHQGFTRVGVGYEHELSAPRFPQDEAMIVVGGVAPAGYAWAFPRGGTRVRVGVGVNQPDVPDNPRLLYDPFAQALARELAGAELLEVHTGRIPSEEAPRRLTGDGLLVVGDSGAHSNPLVGEGIRHVITAARRAAPIAARALSRPGVVPRERLIRWERAGRRTRGTAWGLAMRANRYMSRMGDEDWDRALDSLAALPAPAVTSLMRNDILSLPMLVGTLTRRPSTAWSVMRPFVRSARA